MNKTATKYSFVPAGATVQTVSELTRQIGATLERQFPSIWVEGEITGLTLAASGHLYFSLKDANATLKCAMFRTETLRLPAGFRPGDGIEVIACGRIAAYAQRSEYQLVLERMYPKGLGAAEQALRDLREKLLSLGYFDPRRDRKSVV